MDASRRASAPGQRAAGTWTDTLTNWLWRIGLTLLACACALVLFCLWIFRCPVDLGSLRRVELGMTRAEVEALIGEPSVSLDGGRRTRYETFLGWETVYADYDEAGSLTRLEHDR